MKDLIKFLDKYNVTYTIEGDYIIADNIDLSNKNITELPESIGNIKCNNLYLNYNNLTSLPESIGNIKCNNLYLSYNKLTSLPNYERFKEIEIGDDYLYCDGILTHYESIKNIGEYKVYIGYNDNVVVTKDDKIFAHGMSIKQGIRDLLFKLSNRDKSDYEDLDIDSELEIEEAIIMYRAITGACSYGVEQFMEGREFSNKISIKEIGELIGNEYGSREFREFFKL